MSATNPETSGTPYAFPGSTTEPAQTTRILVLPPGRVHTPVGNRVPELDSVGDLLASITDEGQLVPGIVYSHPDIPQQWMCAAGNRRLFCCRVLGIDFKAVVLEGPVSEARLITLRLTENEIRENMSPLEVARDILRFMDLEGCTQEEAAVRHKLSEGYVSKLLAVPRRLTPDLWPLVDNRTLCPTVAPLIASLPTPELQRELAQRCTQHNLKREAVEKIVRRLKGNKSRQSCEKPLCIRIDGIQLHVKRPTREALSAFHTKLGEGLRKLAKDDRLPISVLPSLLG